MKEKYIQLYFKGLLMGAADIVPGVSGGTMALITGIYEELIYSINGLTLKKLSLLKKEGVMPFWQAINGAFLLPLFIGVCSGILFLSSGITYLIEFYPILIWSFFFGLILASIFILIKQVGKRKGLHHFLLLIGFLVAYGITRLSPSGESTNLLYLFFSSTIAIIAMILPGISGAFIFILLGVYEEVLQTVKGAVAVLVDFDWQSFQSIYTKVAVIGLGIITGLKLFSRILSWLFTHKKQETLCLLIGFMIGALPKIWPWKTLQYIHGKEVVSNVSPLTYEGETLFLPAVLLMGLGVLMLILMERFAQNE
jgi:putative membrane protein